MYMGDKHRFSDEDIQLASSFNILDFAIESGLNPIKVSSNSYKIPSYGGLYISADGSKWNHFSENIGGGPIQFVMHIENKTWVEAVKQLLSRNVSNGSTFEQNAKYEKSYPKEKEDKFLLPEKNNTYKHIFAYLIAYRKLDKGIVYKMVKEQKLYENTHRACVFVGHNKEGEAKYASIRSTNANGSVFRGDVKGSDKSYGFHIKGNTDTIRVFESPIDVMSYCTIMKPFFNEKNKGHLLSLGGVSDKALERYLIEHPEIKKISLCLDNDEAGYLAVHQMFKRYSKDYQMTCYYPKLKDWNEDLKWQAEKKKLLLEAEEATF